MSVKAIGRRLFSRGVVGAPVAMASANVWTPGGSAGGPPTSASVSASLTDKIWQTIWKAGRGDSRRDDIDNWQRQLLGGLDPDLAVLNSLPFSQRVRMQRERVVRRMNERMTFRATIAKALGGDPEDFS